MSILATPHPHALPLPRVYGRPTTWSTEKSSGRYKRRIDGGSVGVAAGVGALAFQQRSLQRLDYIVDARFGHADDRVLLRDLDRADLATAEVALVRDETDEVTGADAHLAAQRDVDEGGPRASASTRTGRAALTPMAGACVAGGSVGTGTAFDLV